MNKITQSEAIAYSKVLEKVLVLLRFQSSRVQPDQLFDLTDALHNLPGLIVSLVPWNSDEYNSMYFIPYDKKWVNSESDALGISLVKTFNAVNKPIV